MLEKNSRELHVELQACFVVAYSSGDLIKNILYHHKVYFLYILYSFDIYLASAVQFFCGTKLYSNKHAASNVFLLI